MSKKPTFNHIWILFLLVPILSLTLAYIYMCFQYQRLILFDMIVHENGKLTFIQTVFYFEHFWREFLLNTFLVLFCVSIFFFYESSHRNLRGVHSEKSKKILILVITFMIFFLIILFIGSISNIGINETIYNILQYKINETIYEFGSHWRFHLLSRICLFLTSISLITMYRMTHDKFKWKRNEKALRFLIMIVICFVILTLLFGINEQPFSDKRFIAHQSREYFTHTLVQLC